jgi:hypothetical protein
MQVELHIWRQKGSIILSPDHLSQQMSRLSLGR